MAEFKELKVRFCDPSIIDENGLRGNSYSFKFGYHPQSIRREYKPGDNRNPYFDLMEDLMLVEIGLLKEPKEGETEAEENYRCAKRARIENCLKQLMVLKALNLTLKDMVQTADLDVLEAALQVKSELAGQKLNSDQTKELLDLIKRA